MRQPQYLAIAAELRRQLAAGDFSPGQLLPSESELSAEHRASRVTVRKALAELKGEGILNSRQGFGWYVLGPPLRQSLRDLTTLDRQIRAAGRAPSRKILRVEEVPAPARLADLLGTGPVLQVERIDCVDRQPFATATVWVRAELASSVTRGSLERRPLSDQLSVVLGGATQAITAVAAASREAELLRLPEGAPLLRCDRTTSDTSTRAVLRSEAFYNPLVTQFVAELPPALDDGLRLRTRTEPD